MKKNNEATTPAEENEETTSSKGEEAITSENPDAEVSSDEKVVKLQSQVDDLTRQVEQSKNLQRQADKKARIEGVEKKRLEKRLKQISSGEIEIEEGEQEEGTFEEKDIRLKVKADVMGLILDNSKYQELLKSDITLKEVLRKNPFALINDYLDAEDVVEQVKDLLDTRISSLEAEKVSNQPKEEKEKGKQEFNVGAVQPSEETQKSDDENLEPVSVMDKVEKSIVSKLA